MIPIPPEADQNTRSAFLAIQNELDSLRRQLEAAKTASTEEAVKEEDDLDPDVEVRGNTVVDGAVLLGDGTEAIPSLGFVTDLDTGLRLPSAGAMNFITAGADRWQFNASGHLLAVDDNTYDIGASGATRPRNLYLAGNITYGGTISGTITRTRTHGVALIDSNGLSADIVYHSYWQETGGSITGAWAKRGGGTGATVNVQNNGSDIRSSDLSLTTTSWTSFGTLQNASITGSTSLDFELASVTGTVTDITIMIAFTTTV